MASTTSRDETGSDDPLLVGTVPPRGRGRGNGTGRNALPVSGPSPADEFEVPARKGEREPDVPVSADDPIWAASAPVRQGPDTAPIAVVAPSADSTAASVTGSVVDDEARVAPTVADPVVADPVIGDPIVVVPAVVPAEPALAPVATPPPAPGGPTPPPVKPRRKQRPKSVRVPRRPRVRKVSRVVRSIDAWTVFKVSAVFYLAMYVVFLVAGVLLWNVAYSTGTIDNVSGFFESFGWERFEFNGGEIYHNAWIIGLFAVAALTGLNVVLATLYNLITDLVGGVRLTVLEEEVLVRPATNHAGTTAPRPPSASAVTVSRKQMRRARRAAPSVPKSG